MTKTNKDLILFEVSTVFPKQINVPQSHRQSKDTSINQTRRLRPKPGANQTVVLGDMFLIESDKY